MILAALVKRHGICNSELNVTGLLKMIMYLWLGTKYLRSNEFSMSQTTLSTGSVPVAIF